jgi:hypothetical protein
MVSVDLRHTFSSRVRACADAFTVRDRPGRADVKVTGIRTNPRLEETRRAVEALSASRGQGKVPDFKAG